MGWMQNTLEYGVLPESGGWSRNIGQALVFCTGELEVEWVTGIFYHN